MNGYSSSVGAITSGGCASSVCSHLRRLSPPFAHPNPKRVHRGRRRRQRRRRRRRCRRHRRRRRWNVPLAACTVGAHSLSHRRRRPVLHAGHTLCRPACAHVWTAGAAPSATCPYASRGAGTVPAPRPLRAVASLVGSRWRQQRPCPPRPRPPHQARSSPVAAAAAAAAAAGRASAPCARASAARTLAVAPHRRCAAAQTAGRASTAACARREARRCGACC